MAVSRAVRARFVGAASVGAMWAVVVGALLEEVVLEVVVAFLGTAVVVAISAAMYKAVSCYVRDRCESVNR